jgi:carboxyl-terminal processing protease
MAALMIKNLLQAQQRNWILRHSFTTFLTTAGSKKVISTLHFTLLSKLPFNLHFKLLSTLLSTVLAFALSSATSLAATEADPSDEGSNAQPSSTDAAPLPINAMRRFVDVYEKVRINYVESVSDEVLFDNALRGLLSNLDPYSDFLDAQTYDAIIDFTDGEIGQTGLVVQSVAVQPVAAPSSEQNLVNDRITPVSVQSVPRWQITSVSKGSPAAKAGIQVGDFLLKIDGKSIKLLTQTDIEQMLRGPRNSTVRLSVMQTGKQPRDVRVLLAIPEDNAVKALIQPDGIVALQIRALQTQTAAQITTALDPLYKNGKLKGVVLDLRDNPGGLLTTGIDLANLFLNDGVIVYTQGRSEPENYYRVLTSERYPSIPVYILINHYSASAAEVVTGALRDHNRAKVYGITSYGKGSVQKVWPIGQGRAIKMTVARYFTPSGRMIEGVGITPDVLIPEAEIKPVKSSGTTIDPRDIALIKVVTALHHQLNPIPPSAPTANAAIQPTTSLPNAGALSISK